MPKHRPSRRRFLSVSGAAAGFTLAGIHLPALLPLARAAATARDAQSGFANLSAAEAADIEAICAQIIPSGDTPGAREAGVVYFVDAAIGAQFEHMRGPLLEQLAAVNALAGNDPPRFSQLDEARQLACMEAADEAGQLGMLITLTLFGMFSMPGYGGNRDHVGWDLIGFDHRHAWFPPFGHYDANYGEGVEDGDLDAGAAG